METRPREQSHGSSWVPGNQEGRHPALLHKVSGESLPGLRRCHAEESK